MHRGILITLARKQHRSLACVLALLLVLFGTLHVPSGGALAGQARQHALTTEADGLVAVLSQPAKQVREDVSPAPGGIMEDADAQVQPLRASLDHPIDEQATPLVAHLIYTQITSSCL